ncbi:hypothetical protein [Bacillus thuringiensis]|uniref:hypothetical protein n=1 Tax=Bacillus cereus group TaxID=86661 RepID=UPI001298AEA3|nr:hypothetical protein [Bacillus thuringiensis]MEB9420025.1 hypothetical protein [Bacillus cereus]MEB9509627.1 hypothetical protein [Bacillus cereus]MEB9561719.1 hypothetical protein [Bacillus cereus]MRC03037.1 hypothetical protein [Bacillus thuringiensis]MRC76375.1 hypothetical protein [Bacillus thuringiensis]
MPSQMNNHLRRYVQEGIQKKLRLNSLIGMYKAQLAKTKEDVIDQSDLQRKMEYNGIAESKIKQITLRLNKDQEIEKQATKILNELNADMDNLTVEMNPHLEELSSIEIESGGFVTHAIGVDKDTVLDKENMILKLKKNSHAEIPIGVRLDSWKDSSQFTISREQKGSL